jgi:hypothetical protein
MNTSLDNCGPKKRFKLSALVIGFWLFVIAVGAAVVLRHAYTPGVARAVPQTWPTGTRISLNTSGPTLIMFTHPQCPCTRASLGELANIAGNCGGHFKAQVWFTKPAGTPDNWTNTVIWRQAAAIPGVAVYCDDLGAEALRFHAETSGETVMYDRAGKLLFQGGITLSRGHAGDNPARDALESLLQHQLFNSVQSAVYGCPLFSSHFPLPETSRTKK